MKYSLVKIEGNIYVKNNYIGDSFFIDSLRDRVSCQCCVFFSDVSRVKYGNCRFRKYDCVGAYFTRLSIDELLKALKEK